MNSASGIAPPLPLDFEPPPLPQLSSAMQLAVMLRSLHALGYDDGLAGHVTMRATDGSLLVNPLELAWDEVSAGDIVVIDESGHKIAGRYNPSPAISLHIELRRLSPSTGIFLHAHPRWAGLWAAARRVPGIFDQTSAQIPHELRLIDEYEGQFDVGHDAARIARRAHDAAWCLLANHGVLIAGPDPATTWLRAYTLEWRSRRAFEVEQLGGNVPLPSDVARAFGDRFEVTSPDMWWQAAVRRVLRDHPTALDDAKF